MAEHIIKVHSISPATGFVFNDNGARVACFALVSSVNMDHPTLAPGQQIIAIGEHDIGQDLLGVEVTQRMSLIDCIA